MRDANVVSVDGVARRVIPCPDGKVGCEVLHTVPVTDTERLDWLQGQSTGYGRGWLARESRTGRGYRLLETSELGGKASVREAIDAAMARGEE